MSDDEQLDLLRLNLVSGVGPRLQSLLLGRFGSAGAIFQATGPELLQLDGVGPKISAALAAARRSEQPALERDRCRELGIDLRFRGGPDYPKLLSETCDAPPILYCQGELLPQDSLTVAIVGSRRCTLYGRQTAERLASALARAGMTIVSGLARGIDAAAHRGALVAGGRTLAVCATGLTRIYPPEHAGLSQEIGASGAVLSESPLDRGPSPGIFPQRNRIISGLSLGVIIVEASRQSGALHTARHAMEQGREVFAVPGRIDSLASQGCHDLLRDGATLVRDPDDVLQELGPLLEPIARTPDDIVQSPRELSLSDQERDVLNLLTRDPQHIDQVIAAGSIEPSRVLSTITVLEMRRLVQRLPGGMLVRVTH